MVYFLLCAALLKIPLRMLGGLLIVLYSSSDVAVFILLTSLLTFLVSLSLSSTFALTYLLTSGFISGIIVIFKLLVVVMQINFTLALSFAAAQYIFVSVFTPSGAINLLVQLPTKLILLTLIFLHSNSVIPTLLSLLFLSLATFATSMRILFLLGSTAQVPSLLNLFFDLPDVTAINFFVVRCDPRFDFRNCRIRTYEFVGICCHRWITIDAAAAAKIYLVVVRRKPSFLGFDRAMDFVR